MQEMQEFKQVVQNYRPQLIALDTTSSQCCLPPTTPGGPKSTTVTENMSTVTVAAQVVWERYNALEVAATKREEILTSFLPSVQQYESSRGAWCTILEKWEGQVANLPSPATKPALVEQQIIEIKVTDNHTLYLLRACTCTNLSMIDLYMPQKVFNSPTQFSRVGTLCPTLLLYMYTFVDWVGINFLGFFLLLFACVPHTVWKHTMYEPFSLPFVDFRVCCSPSQTTNQTSCPSRETATPSVWDRLASRGYSLTSDNFVAPVPNTLPRKSTKSLGKRRTPTQVKVCLRGNRPRCNTDRDRLNWTRRCPTTIDVWKNSRRSSECV